MGGSDGAFNVYLQTFKVREELEARAKKEAEGNANATQPMFTKSAQYSGDSKAALEFFTASAITTSQQSPTA